MAPVFQMNNYRTYAFGKRHTHGGDDAGWDVQQSHLCNETPGNSYTEWVEKMGYDKEFAKDWAAEFWKGSSSSFYANEKLPVSSLCSVCLDMHELESNVKVLRDMKKLSEADTIGRDGIKCHVVYC